MRSANRRRRRGFALAAMMFIIITASTRLQADTGTCGGQMITLPFTDVSGGGTFFCSIAEAYFSGLTNGTTSTTYSPGDPVPREQMAAFISRTMDQALKRGSQAAALDQFRNPQTANNLALTTVGSGPELVKSDSVDIWVANSTSGSVSRVRASDGSVVETWPGAPSAFGVLCAMGKVFVTGNTNPGSLYQIDPTVMPGTATTLSSGLGANPTSIAYDGQRIWTANSGGSVSIITLNPTAVTNVATGFNQPTGMIYDGANIWVTDPPTGKLKQLDSSGNILLTISVGGDPRFAAFDGMNIWIANFTPNTLTVVRAVGGLAGTVLATISGNGLNHPNTIAFDGERILVTNNGAKSVSLWRASDLTPIGTFPTGANPFGVCSDGLNFWITFFGAGQLARF